MAGPVEATSAPDCTSDSEKRAAKAGISGTARDYLGELAGLSHEAIFATWLGDDHPGLDRLRERIARYQARVTDGATVSPEVRSAVHYAAERVPVGIVSGAARDEIEPVISAAGLRDATAFVVSADDVAEPTLIDAISPELIRGLLA